MVVIDDFFELYGKNSTHFWDEDFTMVITGSGFTGTNISIYMEMEGGGEFPTHPEWEGDPLEVDTFYEVDIISDDYAELSFTVPMTMIQTIEETLILTVYVDEVATPFTYEITLYPR